jgi:hypothetical protein
MPNRSDGGSRCGLTYQTRMGTPKSYRKWLVNACLSLWNQAEDRVGSDRNRVTKLSDKIAVDVVYERD